MAIFKLRRKTMKKIKEAEDTYENILGPSGRSYRVYKVARENLVE